MFKLSKRFRFILISLFLTVLVFAAFKLHWPETKTIILILLATPFFTTVVLGLDLVFPEHVIFSIFPSLTLILSTSLAKLNPLKWSGAGEMMLFAAVFILIYVEFLSLNIINVATIRTIPLKKAASSIYSWIGLTLLFFGIFLILDLPFLVLTRISLFVLLLFLVFEALTFAGQTITEVASFEVPNFPRPKVFLGLSLILALISAQFFAALLFLKDSVLLKTLILAAFSFSIFSIFNHNLEKTLSKKILREDLMIIGIFLVILLLTAGQR